MENKLHIFPVYTKGKNLKTTHVTDKSGMCWCKPEFKQVCSESNCRGICKPDCWKCSGEGLVEPYDDDLNLLLIHKAKQLETTGAYFCDCGRAIIDHTRKDGAWCGSCKKLTRTKF